LVDVAYALDMAIACLITYWIMTHTLSRFVDVPSDFLGGMWAVAGTVFVFRETRLRSLSAGIARLIATCVSFALCLLYLLLFPFTPVGMAALIAIGTLVLVLLGRRDDIITAGITTVVVMVVAAMSPADALAAAFVASCRHCGGDRSGCCMQMRRLIFVWVFVESSG
jgi:uncharacterized membrane protein YgaE (UPF0421/DUF939 family)